MRARSEKNVRKFKWISNPCKTSFNLQFGYMHISAVLQVECSVKYVLNTWERFVFFFIACFALNLNYLVMQLCNTQTYTHIKRRSLCWLLVLQIYSPFFNTVFFEYAMPYIFFCCCKNRDIADCYVAHWLLLANVYNQYD